MGNKVNNIVIVGGGTAGWITAAHLNAAFDADVNITLVESETIGTIGVGEASFNTIKVFFDFIGLQEHEWMPQCNATYKMAIKFVNWTTSGGHFYHPFQRYDAVQGFNMTEWWLKIKKNQDPFDYSCFNVPDLCDSRRSPKYFDGKVYDDRTQYPYAYHFDAALLAKFLREVAIKRGVKHIIDDVSKVELRENGEIECVKTVQGQSLYGDLFIDCSGFKGLLINKVLGEPFISFSNSLLCDSAIAMRIPTDDKNDCINPYTTATALSSGWVWDIPLYGRVGTGYVYSNHFITKGEAEKELRTHLGERSNSIEPIHIKMRVGRNRNSWVKNCVSIGLSSGFVEPLESTGIFFIQYAVTELVNHFPDKSFNDALIKNYNKIIASCIDGIKDFLTLHYCVTNRTDTEFWKAAKYDLEIPEDLRERLNLWKNRLPNASNINTAYHGFAPYSYSVILLGLNYCPESSLPTLEYLSDQNAHETFIAIKKRSHHLRTTLPSHYEYLTVLYGL